MPDSIETIVQQLELPNVVELISISYQGVHYYLTNSLSSGGIYWNGQFYQSFPLSISGVSYNETNGNETPKLQVSNVQQQFTALLNLIPILKGASVEFVRTFETYTGTTALASSSLYIYKRTFTIDKLLSKTAEHLIYELGTLTNLKGLIFPRRQMLRDGRPRLRFEGLGINKQSN
jgi:lambda family phage minor tail protein L